MIDDKLLWQHFKNGYAKGRLAHALLLLGSLRPELVEFSRKIAALILCMQVEKPCGQCQSCRLLKANEHPDLDYVQPDKPGGVIKIEQVRHIQNKIFTSSQLGNGRVIIINPAEKMNTAAANALLKLLEEPPAQVHFILIAEQISSIAPTILSRCQQWRFAAQAVLNSDYLAWGEASPRENSKIFADLNQIMQDLLITADNQTSLCSVAEKWSGYDFNDLLWLLYLIHAQIIDYCLRGHCSQRISSLFPSPQAWGEGARRADEGLSMQSSFVDVSGYVREEPSQFLALAQRFKLVFFFNQLDKINEIMKKLVNNIHVNALLALEDFLLAYTNPNRYAD